MQDLIPWKDGYIKYTSAHYLTPDENDIHEIGITPDIEVESEEYSREELSAYYRFMDEKRTEILKYVEDNPEYTQENIEAFAGQYEESGVPALLLKLLIRNEYVYSMPYDERPLTDTVYDRELTAAIDYLDSL